MTVLLGSSAGPGWAVGVPGARQDPPAPAALLRLVPAVAPAVPAAACESREPRPRLRLTRRARGLLLIGALLTVAVGGTAHGFTAPVDGSTGQLSWSSSGQVAPGVPLGTGMAGR